MNPSDNDKDHDNQTAQEDIPLNRESDLSADKSNDLDETNTPNLDKQINESSTDSTTATQSPTTTEQNTKADDSKAQSSPFIIVLQWLTYAFWGWAVLALGVLIGNNLAFFINDSDTAGFTPYSIAAVLVLLPIALVCDRFYSKHEPAKKTGGGAIVMVIHAVIFALLGVGSIMTAIFMIIKMFISDTSNNSSTITLLTAIIMAFLYAVVLARTINPPKLKNIPKLSTFIMVTTMSLAIITSVAGPIAKERSTRNDRLIDRGISRLSSSINDYAHENKRLPSSLEDLNLSTTNYNKDARALITNKLVEYKPMTNSPVQTPDSQTSDSSSKVVTITNDPYDYRTQSLKYKLCVKYASKSKYYNQYHKHSSNNTYQSYLDASSHPAGNYCYWLKAEVSY